MVVLWDRLWHDNLSFINISLISHQTNSLWSMVRIPVDDIYFLPWLMSKLLHLSGRKNFLFIIWFDWLIDVIIKMRDDLNSSHLIISFIIYHLISSTISSHQPSHQPNQLCDCHVVWWRLVWLILTSQSSMIPF